MKYILILMCVILGALIYLEGSNPYEYKECKPYCDVVVTRVIDGDTFVTQSGMRIRLAGIDAPEIHTHLGKIQKNCLKELIEGKKVRLKLLSHDKYGRQIAQVTSHRTTCRWSEV